MQALSHCAKWGVSRNVNMTGVSPLNRKPANINAPTRVNLTVYTSPRYLLKKE